MLTEVMPDHREQEKVAASSRNYRDGAQHRLGDHFARSRGFGERCPCGRNNHFDGRRHGYRLLDLAALRRTDDRVAVLHGK